MIRALWSTEITKLKRSSTVWFSVIFPVLILSLALISLLGEYAHWVPRPPRPAEAEWESILKPWWALWTAAVIPLLIAMEAAGLTSPEHLGKHWKQLYTLPIPRWRFFAVKAMVCGLLVGASFVLFAAGVLSMGLLRSFLFHLDMGSAIPWSLTLRLAARTWLASCAMIAAQMWLSIRFPGFAIPVGTALAAAVLGAALRQVGLGGWWPWTMPFDSLPWGVRHVPASPVVSPAICVVLILLASRQISRSEIV
jgi:ABC-2 type transport system permease protein